MKENSKEKLERQLNDNPELKERFNLQMKSITNNVRALTEPLTELTDNLNSQLEAFRFHAEELRVSTTKKYKILESDYNTLVAKYLSYLKKEGMILPLDFNEFFSWIASCRYPDEPFAILEIQPNDFKLFHEYEKRRINNTGWNKNKEWLFLNNQSQGSNNESEPIKYKATHYALAYIFDCDAKGRPRLEGRKNELEKIGRERSNNKIDGNTFYKAFNRINNKDLNIERNLIDITGTNWKNIILDLSEAPDLLDKYLKTKQL